MMADKYKQKIEKELGEAEVERLEMENKNWLEVSGDKKFKKKWHKSMRRLGC